MSAPMFSYNPAPHERAYYGALFQAADTEHGGSIGGAQAVEFFTRSKLPVGVLRQIWSAADQPPSNSLDPRKFAVAIRLIQLEQNGIQPNSDHPDLAQAGGPNLRPAFFEGVPTPPSPSRGLPQPQEMHQPPRSNMMDPNGGSAMTGVLTVQDPYTLHPQEQARYDQIFPTYCKQDPNYVDTAEAVALFSKSGLEQHQLASIWGMVDVPSDNRLDKLEFAMAMHLIVCVSKKNLPVPPALPMSLKQLKSLQPTGHSNSTIGPDRVATRQRIESLGGESLSGPPSISRSHISTAPQQQQQQHHLAGPKPPQSMQQQQQRPSMSEPDAMMQQHMPIPPPENRMPQNSSMPPHGMTMQQNSSMPSVSSGGIPSPERGSRQSGFGTISSPGNMQSSSLSGLPGPPPLSQTLGSVSISDAFENLAGSDDTSSVANYQSTLPPLQRNDQFSAPTMSMSFQKDEEPEPELAPAPPKTTQQLASSYDMGDSHEELVKLKVILQKLQAENISLKAKMGGMTEEEKDIQKELNATVAEVSQLFDELTKLRAQVLASKSRLLEASAELKASKEKKGVIQDLIAEANATKQAIDEAYESIEAANEAVHAAPPAPTPVTETDFFGGWGSKTAPLPVATQSESIPPPVRSEPQPLPVQHNETPTYSYNPAPVPAAPGMFDGGGYNPGHNRDISNTSGFGEVMGSGPGIGQSLSVVGENSAYGGKILASPSMGEVEVLKSRSREADEVARDAEESRRQLSASLEEIRRLADEAEEKSRQASAAPVKKKGFLRGGGGKTVKKDSQELQKLAMDAKEKKEKLLELQAQLKDAEALANATRQEAERLNKAAEDAQLQAASMASMQQSQPGQTSQTAKVQPQTTNGYGFPSQPSMQQPDGIDDSGFGIMGSGGTSIPTPADAPVDDPFSNPFYE